MIRCVRLGVGLLIERFIMNGALSGAKRNTHKRAKFNKGVTLSVAPVRRPEDGQHLPPVFPHALMCTTAGGNNSTKTFPEASKNGKTI
jgi:hypothetical protein